MKTKPTLREILEGYNRFNAWEAAVQKDRLARLSITESLTQFLELCYLARTLTPDTGQLFSEQDRAYWIELRQKRLRAAKVMGYARAATGLVRSQDL
ncbi:MAG: hypothetical protein AB1791_09105 [Chloroflexota bacterium]